MPHAHEGVESFMANVEHVNLVRQRKAVWNDWRERHPRIAPDLRGSDLRRADLFERNLANADIRGADLLGADLRQADLRGSNLGGAILRHASLRQSQLTNANLSGADLYDANLYCATLTQATLCDANLITADLSKATFRGADLSNAKLALSRLIGTSFADANLTGCCVYGVAVWDVDLSGAVQSNLVVNPLEEPTITVDNLEIAQFVHLLLNNARIRDVIDTVTSKAVLILGRFTPERKPVLEALKNGLRRHNLLPILFDFDKPSTRGIHETVTTLARLAKFVVADITDPRSIPQELVAIVQSMPSLPIQPILLDGEEPWGMYDHIAAYPWVLDLYHYRDVKGLVRAIPKAIIGPAERHLRKAQRRRAAK